MNWYLTSLVIKEIAKPPYDTTSQPLGCAQLKSLITSVGKDGEKLKPSCIAHNDVKWCSFENCLTASEKVKNRVTVYYRNFTPRLLSLLHTHTHTHTRIENIHPHRNLYTNVKSIIHSIQEVKTTQIVHWWIDKHSISIQCNIIHQ